MPHRRGPRHAPQAPIDSHRARLYHGAMASYDSVVIGGGVMGSAIGLHLARAGQKVLVLEKSVPGAEASSAAGGILGAQIEGEEDGPVFRLCLASREAWPAFAAEVAEASGVELDFRPCGVLQVGFSQDDLAPLQKKAAWQLQADLPVEELGADELRRLEPGLGPEVVGGLHFPKDLQVDPRQLARALPVAAERAGAHFRQAVVERIRVEDGRATGVQLQDGEVHAGAVVVAAGAWTSLVEGTGLPAEAVQPVRGQMLRLAPRRLSLGRIVFGPRGYLVPRVDGTVLAGSTMERVGYDKRVTAGGIQSILSLALRLAPDLADAELCESWSGLRPAPADGLPLVGEAAIPGLYVASGHHRNGILLTPETARLVARTVVGGSEPEELRPFSPRRFAR